MLYVSSPAEDMPFADEYFDIVTSFNSLDHVDNLEKAIGEIIRVTKPAGLLLLLTDVNHEPTAAEPNSFSWDILEKFLPKMKVLESKHYEKSQHGIYQSIKAGITYDDSNPVKRYMCCLPNCRNCLTIKLFHRRVGLNDSEGVEI
jgi:ubiquinone/menaquinone biosynthesis C-methylase UbiE